MLVNKQIQRGDMVDLEFTIDGDLSAKKVVFIAKYNKDFASPRLIEKKNMPAGGGDTELEISYTSGVSTITVHLLAGNTQILNVDYIHFDIFNATDSETLVYGRLFLIADVQTPYDSGSVPSSVLPILNKAIYLVIEDGVITTESYYGFDENPTVAVVEGASDDLTISSNDELELSGISDSNDKNWKTITQTDKNSIVVSWDSGAFSGKTVTFIWHYYSSADVGQSTAISYGVRTWGTTAERPTLTSNDVGFEYYDTDINSPVWWNGTEWI